MNINNKDIFESSKQNIFTQKELFDKNNFFLMDETDVLTKNNVFSERTRRLNDYDFNLLKEGAYKDISDDTFKLEYKISKTEDEIKSLDARIQAAKDIKDFNLVEDLNQRKASVEEDYQTLLAIYNDKSLSAKISDSISGIIGNKLKEKIQSINKKINNITDSIIAKMPKRFASIIEIKKSLEKLENINRSVDELISLNIPYGENIDKYQQLSKYIIKANSIQSEIARHIK